MLERSLRSLWLLCAFTLLFSVTIFCPSAVNADALSQGFVNPPASARPWVYWFWLNGNITREGITADLEAMKQAGIGGVLIMEVDQGAPAGPVAFASAQWRSLFSFVCSEAHRLGIEVNMTNDAGWCGSGGPWVTPDLSMQKVVWTETSVQGGAEVNVALPQAKNIPIPPLFRLVEDAASANYYEDINVLAVAAPLDDTYRIPDILQKAGFVHGPVVHPAATAATIPTSQVIPLSGVIDVTSDVHDGVLSWQAPPGRWTIFRFGHASTRVPNYPSPLAGRGLETDKLSKLATESHFNALVGSLVTQNQEFVGSTLVRTHIDSAERGTANWTMLMPQEFQERNGYDLTPYLPVLTGRVVGSLEISDRFLWDYRRTLAEMLRDNYAERMEELARGRGIGLSIEAYGDCLTDDIEYGGRADEPMGEVWSWPLFSNSNSVTEMTSAGHIYGHPIIGAESFTADQSEKWLGHPAVLKNIADWEFCEGINRVVVHRYAMQPWLDRAPGMSMGPWGVHYERTQTWWKESLDWHKYLARCQYMLRQGSFVADVCYLESEGAPNHGVDGPRNGVDREGYDFDECTPDALTSRFSVRDGQLALPDGVRYRLLVLPKISTMTPTLLARIKALVDEGASVLGQAPVRSPSLRGYPLCDDQVRALAAELWGNADGKTVFEHKLGKGVVYIGKSVSDVMSDMKVPLDFSSGVGSPFRYTHRNSPDGTDVFFVANRTQLARETICAFRVTAGRPQFWLPESGRMERLAIYSQSGGMTRIPVRLEAGQSVFVIFDGSSADSPHIVDIARDGQAWPGATLHEVRVPALPALLPIDGPWQVAFPAQGIPAQGAAYDRLGSWSESDNKQIKYFSGTAQYSINFDVPPALIGPNKVLDLDLGNVQVMANVTLNGKKLGLLWKPPYRIDVTNAVKSGFNRLTLNVTNLWINRMIGDEQLPEDSDRNPGGTLKQWPQWLLDGKPSPTGRVTFTTWRLWNKDSQLQPSGLIGPVRLISGYCKDVSER